jgi:hypothetical protein
MTDTEPMYLISESELKELVEDSSEDTYGSFDGVEIGEKVRARGPVAQHDAAIAARAAATERERVRGWLLAWLEGHWTYTKVKRYGKWVDRSSLDYESTKQKIESLLSNPDSKRGCEPE